MGDRMFGRSKGEESACASSPDRAGVKLDATRLHRVSSIQDGAMCAAESYQRMTGAGLARRLLPQRRPWELRRPHLFRKKAEYALSAEVANGWPDGCCGQVLVAVRIGVPAAFDTQQLSRSFANPPCDRSCHHAVAVAIELQRVSGPAMASIAGSVGRRGLIDTRLETPIRLGAGHCRFDVGPAGIGRAMDLQYGNRPAGQAGRAGFVLIRTAHGCDGGEPIGHRAGEFVRERSSVGESRREHRVAIDVQPTSKMIENRAHVGGVVDPGCTGRPADAQPAAAAAARVPGALRASRRDSRTARIHDGEAVALCDLMPAGRVGSCAGRATHPDRTVDVAAASVEHQHHGCRDTGIGCTRPVGGIRPIGPARQCALLETCCRCARRQGRLPALAENRL